MARRRRQLSDEELEELRSLIRGKPSSPLAAWAALIAAIAALWSAISVTALAIIDRIIGFVAVPLILAKLAWRVFWGD